MQSRFVDFVRANNLVSSNEKILLGVSGGVDSMVMLNLFYKSGFSFSVAHCNFSLRGEESDGDEALVTKTCSDKGIELFRTRFETERYAEENKLSIQVAARNLRYDWFNKLCYEHGFSKIAIAHNRDDVAETLILNLTRGTGLKGLSGIRMVNGRVIRPLLSFSRDEISSYASAHRVDFREDSSNSSVKYARNRIRHNVLPELEKLNHSVKRSIAQTANHVNETLCLLEDYLSSIRKDIVVEESGFKKYSIPKLLDEKHSKLFLFEELVPLGFSYDSIDQIMHSLGGQPGKRIISSNHQLLLDRDFLILSKRSENEVQNVLIDSDYNTIDLPVSLRFEIINEIKNFKIPIEINVAVLDYDKLVFPLEIRNWHHGDRFIPFGMKNYKKISDFLIDQKISMVEKENVHVVTSNGEIVWVVGMRIDERFRVDSNSKKLFKIEQL